MIPIWIQISCLVLGVCGGFAGVLGLIGAYYLLPYRVNQIELKLNELTAQANFDRSMLIRIDERMKRLMEKHGLDTNEH